MKAIALAVVLSLATTAPAYSATWYIKPDGSGDAPRIQAEIDSPAVGDEIVLAWKISLP